MKMNVLKCQSAEGVMKELAMYLLAYNLVRPGNAPGRTATRVSVDRISFIDALRWLSCRMLGLSGVE